MMRRLSVSSAPAWLLVLVSTGAAPARGPAQLAAARTGETQQTWWAYRPLRRPPVPAPPARWARWVRNPIDAFVLRRLAAKGLGPAPEAGRAALLRRAAYDLTGLPPRPAEVRAFVAGGAPDAFERQIERLLASDQYGVKWGRHWLDLVRFAETDSFERDRKKPSAWRYRDYVIDSFNADKPYDRFLLEQLAGDEVARPTLETVVATGYHRLGIWDDEPTDTLQAVYDDLDDILDTTCRVMLGVSMGCARCHEHKRDPIPQRDYYRMLAFFEGIKPYKVGGGNAPSPRNYTRKVPVDLGRGDFAAQLAEWRAQGTELLREIENLAAEAWKYAGSDAGTGARAELRRGLVSRPSFDHPAASGCEVHDAVSVPGKHGRALRFDGRHDYARLARPVQDDFSIAFWFLAERPGRGSRNDLRWFRGSGLVDAEIHGIVDDFGVSLIEGHVCAGTGRPETFLHSEGGHADGKWHHVAFTRERKSGRITLWVDGRRVDEKRGSTRALKTPTHVTIGRLLSGRGHFAGLIEDVRFYDRVLDGRDVAILGRGAAFARSTERTVVDRLGAPEGARYRAAVERWLALERPRRDTVQVLCAQEAGTRVAPSFVRVRGNVHAKGARVAPGFPAIFGGGEATIVPPAGGRSSGRRLALARWITDPRHPATARVMVNRLWQYHFGRGLVRTPNDFGRLGQRPTHPELLDWLATEFVARRWSMKSMHRLIMTSATYRMSSASNAAAAEVDPPNDLYGRFDMRRLTAEEVRDSILQVAGILNLERGGPSVYPEMPGEVLATSSRPEQAWGRSSPAQAARRSVYIHVKRSLLMPLLTAFDLADTDSSCPVRFVTTPPTQALTMLNSDFLQEQAANLAARLQRVGDSPRDRVQLGLRLVTQREPAAADIADGLALLGELQGGEARPRAWQNLCLVLLNLNEFLYLD